MSSVPRNPIRDSPSVADDGGAVLDDAAFAHQQQIDSEVAGVAFSLNPLTNDYDEAVIDANWGLGESVVAGLVSPDHFVVDKVGRRVVDKRRGAKQVSIWLGPDGGTTERKNQRSAELTLGDAQLSELTDVIRRIETLYEKPMDIEWAYAGGQLHVLQARPITTYVPLPPKMLTRPGERRRLYMDIALSKGMAMNAPISPMGLDWMEEGISKLVERFLGRRDVDLTREQAYWFFAGGRMYQDLSNLMWLASPKRLSKMVASNDALMGKTLASVDVARYRAAMRPPWARFRMIRFLPRALWRLRGFFWNTLRAILSPERAHRVYRRRVEAFELELTQNVDYSLPFDEFHRLYHAPVAQSVFDVTMPALMASFVALGSVDRVVPKKSAEAKGLAEKLKLGFAGNVIAEMGIAMFRLARLLDRSYFEDLTRLAERVEDRQMPAEFLSAWDAFLARFGWRGPLEMDLASTRYADGPGLAMTQMSIMTVDDEGFDPEATHKRHVEERRRAYEELMSRSGWLRRALLRRVHRIIELFAGTRAGRRCS